MKIGIFGSGNVGSALGKIWVNNGHEIMFSLTKNGFYGHLQKMAAR